MHSIFMRVLAKAQAYVEKHGDINWFNEHYTLSREYNGIIDSVENALRQQDLWYSFNEKEYGQ